VSTDSGPPTNLTALLRAGDARLADVVPAVYDELRALARRQLARERPGHTLQATALVNEVWIKLEADLQLGVVDRRRFFAAAGEAMRRVLIDSARKAQSERRGGRAARVELTLDEFPDSADPDRVLALDEAMSKLEAEDSRAAEVARLRIFCGLSPDEVATCLDLAPRTTAREWAYARARLGEWLTTHDSQA
jgi:RNA polymerase sigma-70 factor, ECF subfamily